MPSNGFAAFIQPILDGGTESPLVIGGQPMEPIITSYSMEIPGRAVFVQALGGGHVNQGSLEAAAAPRSLGPMEYEIEVDLISEDQRAFLMGAPALAHSGLLDVYLDVPIVDTWIAQPGQSTFVLSRSTFYGDGPTFSSRPARVFVSTVEQTVVDGIPAAGQYGIDQGSNDNILTAGTAPSTGDVVTLRYYPLMRGDLSFEESIVDFNDGTMSVTFTEFPLIKKYETG